MSKSMALNFGELWCRRFNRGRVSREFPGIPCLSFVGNDVMQCLRVLIQFLGLLSVLHCSAIRKNTALLENTLNFDNFLVEKKTKRHESNSENDLFQHKTNKLRILHRRE